MLNIENSTSFEELFNVLFFFFFLLNSSLMYITKTKTAPLKGQYLSRNLQNNTRVFFEFLFCLFISQELYWN